ncbi:hypothetical protein H4582DRAFT_2065091 [Lactarius indigo]|nr:hypothetical protein H4582DRAFT_2065091 [Lactarius indigo]
MVLTLRTGPPSQQDKWALSSNTWFCGATILLSSITTSILDSSNFFKQGSFPIDPCNNTFHLEESLPVPETQLNYLKEHVAQLSSELMATGNQVMMDEESKWTHIREMEVVDYKNQIWQELEPEFKEWQDELLSGLMGQEVDATLCMLLVWLEAEGPCLKDEALQACQAVALSDDFKEVETEWHQWKDDKLAKAKTEALHSLSLDYMLVHCGDNAAVLIAEKHEIAKGYVSENYQQWVSQALEECWPSVEAEAQKWTRDQYLNLELTWIWPEVGAEAVAVFPQGITPPNRKVQIVQWHTKTSRHSKCARLESTGPSAARHMGKQGQLVLVCPSPRKRGGTGRGRDQWRGGAFPSFPFHATPQDRISLPSRAPFLHEQGGVTTGEGAVYPRVPLLRERGSAAMGKEAGDGEREVVACPCAPRFHANGAAQSWGEVMGKGGRRPLLREWVGMATGKEEAGCNREKGGMCLHAPPFHVNGWRSQGESGGRGEGAGVPCSPPSLASGATCPHVPPFHANLGAWTGGKGWGGGNGKRWR